MSGSMSKFDTILAEHLLNFNDPHEDVGDSSSGAGWAGLWADLGVIVMEATDGSVKTIVCTHENIAMTWADIEHELGSTQEPDEEDYVITQKGGYFVTPIGLTFETYDEALTAIAMHMTESKFWPNVWLVDDHGGFTNISSDLPNLER